MYLAEAIEKSKEAAQLLSYIPTSFRKKLATLPGVGIRLNPDKEYQLVFQLDTEIDLPLVEELYQKLDIKELPHFEITGRAFSLPSNVETRNTSFNHCRPLQMGAYISPLNFSGGTLGCFVEKIADPDKLFILSCAHVIAPLEESCFGDLIVQPGESSVADDGVALLDDFAWLSQADNNVASLLDAAIAKVFCQDTLNIESGFHNSIKLKGSYSEQYLPELLNKKVFKIGSTTGLTSGWITRSGMNRSISYGENIVRGYSNLISIDNKNPNNTDGNSPTTSFSAPGDSGSLIYDETGYAVGLLIGGTASGLTYALPIEPIFERLEIQLVLN